MFDIEKSFFRKLFYHTTLEYNMAQSARSLPTWKFLTRNHDREKHHTELRSKSIRRKPNIHTEAVARKIPAVYETGTQNRHYTF